MATTTPVHISSIISSTYTQPLNEEYSSQNIDHPITNLENLSLHSLDFVQLSEIKNERVTPQIEELPAIENENITPTTSSTINTNVLNDIQNPNDEPNTSLMKRFSETIKNVILSTEDVQSNLKHKRRYIERVETYNLRSTEDSNNNQATTPNIENTSINSSDMEIDPGPDITQAEDILNTLFNKYYIKRPTE